MAEGTSEYVEFNPAARLQLHHWPRIYPTEKTVDQTIGYGYNAVDLTLSPNRDTNKSTRRLSSKRAR